MFYCCFRGLEWFHDVPGPPANSFALTNTQNGGVTVISNMCSAFWDNLWQPESWHARKKTRKMLRTGPLATDFGIYRWKIDPRRSRNVMEPLPTPKTPVKNSKTLILGSVGGFAGFQHRSHAFLWGPVVPLWDPVGSVGPVLSYVWVRKGIAIMLFCFLTSRVGRCAVAHPLPY